MNRVKKLFGQTDMTWKKVIAVSLITGIVTGLLMIPEVLKGTSLQQPGISYEFWIMFALYIALNCKKPVEAGAKTFIAFVISQPVIYLVQVPFCWLGWQIFGYYTTWIIPTILTFPGAILAWYVKKGNMLSVLILSVANLILCVELPSAVLAMLSDFPRLILSVLFIVWEIVFFILCLFNEKKEKAAAFLLAAVMLAAASFNEFNSRVNRVSTMTIYIDDPAPYELISNHELLDISFGEENITINYRPYRLGSEGSETVSYSDGNGNIHEIELFYSDGDLYTED